MRRSTRQQPAGGVKSPAHAANGNLSLIRQYDIETNPSRPIRPSPLTNSALLHGLPLELVDRLRSFPLFASAPDTFLGAIGTYLRPQLHQPHDVILAEGQDARAMYWLVRGTVRVTSRDGESTYAELKAGAFFGEIGILMDIPRTATVTASSRALVVRLAKEDLQKELPNYPDVERAIREEALERLAILERKKNEAKSSSATIGQRKRSRDMIAQDVEFSEFDDLSNDVVVPSSKKRKSPSPDLRSPSSNGGLSKSGVTIRQILRELPLFAGLPPDILHYLGINAQLCTYNPFTDIIKQGTQGRDVYFVVQGLVEVVTESSTPDDLSQGFPSPKTTPRPVQRVKARLKPGQYFGEVTSLALSPRRTATVRTITRVECLRITSEVLDGLWHRCSSHLRQQVECEAKRRLHDASPIHATERPDVLMPTVVFTDAAFDQQTGTDEMVGVTSPLDPDPYFSVELENNRPKSRRSSLAPPSPADDSPTSPSTLTLQTTSTHPRSVSPTSPSRFRAQFLASPGSLSPKSTLPHVVRAPSLQNRGRLEDALLVQVFKHLDLRSLMRVRRVSSHWHHVASTDGSLVRDLDLSKFKNRVTDRALIQCIAPFVGGRAHRVNINNCYHVTDEGFNALGAACVENVRVWEMRSVWEVNGQCILDLVSHAPNLEEIDLSNCRKVGDALLARIVSCKITTRSPLTPLFDNVGLGIASSSSSADVVAAASSPSTPTSKLKRLKLSYCKHIQDRGMAQIAQFASSRLEVIDLTRCTSVTDQGFHHWTMYSFPMLRKLVLADCTYLTDQAIVGIANAARNLRELDLSFCCALSDTATEVLALGLTQLTHLDLAFCGSAVSDSSLRCMGLHLLELRFLSVRGCVRVTGHGVEAIIEGCRYLETLDVSQCKNLGPWIARGGIEKARSRGCRTEFDLVANGSWRCVLR